MQNQKQNLTKNYSEEAEKKDQTTNETKKKLWLYYPRGVHVAKIFAESTTQSFGISCAVCRNLVSVSLDVATGSVNITNKVGINSATTLSRMSLSGYVGHVTIFS